MTQLRAAVLQKLGPVRDRLQALFNEAGCVYPPPAIRLLALKSERQIELWVADKTPLFVKQYKVLAASGEAGPKLVEGDEQVPEGVYSITALNPASRYYLSLRIDYPNAFDRHWAAHDKRQYPGSDIYLHGGAQSVGCLAIGDVAIEELFVLAADTGLANMSIVIAPCDPRVKPLNASGHPPWVKRLYTQIESEFSNFERPAV
jgi:hypothetical protein